MERIYHRRPSGRSLRTSQYPRWRAIPENFGLLWQGLVTSPRYRYQGSRAESLSRPAGQDTALAPVLSIQGFGPHVLFTDLCRNICSIWSKNEASSDKHSISYSRINPLQPIGFKLCRIPLIVSRIESRFLNNGVDFASKSYPKSRGFPAVFSFMLQGLLARTSLLRVHYRWPTRPWKCRLGDSPGTSPNWK